ncbi:KilA-N domain-containing protein [Lacihabitans sp. LS3-19]|uniref:KilA-N domain-containing protein n=1 Tax=Lacihabitans sp. LS3-19 TaxID=2487335 RepID=UPI0020CD8C0C|nr:KilA-N domain-containing protein [Lacihabitans sp. LS3-19]MCP9770464.1 KilA-N domain-containing protein [Lacihabitans sp. LS3-19]
MAKNSIINVQGQDIRVSNLNNEDFISLTDMVKAFDDGSSLIEKWIRNINTIEFLGVWESMYNPDFNLPEFEEFRTRAGLNSFTMSPKKWVEKTNAIGLNSKSGRHGGGTFAHKDIAFEFGSWLSPQFKLFLIKEFQRLKETENNQYNIEWNVKRVLSKANYAIHTDAVKEHLIPQLNIDQNKEWIIYANEADLLNVALFGCTSKMWKDNNSKLASSGKNMRDFASINELTVLSNLESLNSVLITNQIDKKTRFEQLRIVAQAQLKSLSQVDFVKSLKKTSGTTYIDAQKNSDQNGISFEGSFGDAISKISKAGKPKSKKP